MLFRSAQKEQVTIFERPDDPANGFSAALERMRMYDRVYAFVLDEQHKVLGVVSAESLLACVNQPGKKIRDAILPGKTAIPSSMPLNEVMQKVVEYACPLPVVDEQGEYIGAITKTVLLRKLCKEKSA